MISQFRNLVINYITLNKMVPLFIFDFVDHQCFHEYFIGKKRLFHSFRAEVALLRYIVFYCKLGCDTSEPHMSYISRACSSLVRQPILRPKLHHLENQRLGDHTCERERSFGWQNISYRRIYVHFSSLTVHKVCTKAILLGERSVRIREVKGSNPSRSTFSSSVILTLLLFFCVHISHTLAL